MNPRQYTSTANLTALFHITILAQFSLACTLFFNIIIWLKYFRIILILALLNFRENERPQTFVGFLQIVVDNHDVEVAGGFAVVQFFLGG